MQLRTSNADGCLYFLQQRVVDPIAVVHVTNCLAAVSLEAAMAATLERHTAALWQACTPSPG